jgi:hypothetical protein
MSVQRIDHAPKRMHGWQARRRFRNGKYESKFFADRKYGGSRVAWTLAVMADRLFIAIDKARV